MSRGGGNATVVSVVIPTYYRNDLLPTTIENALGQTYESIQVVVVDDSGEAHAASVVDRYPDVEYVALPTNRGANGARNAGARRATGAFVHFLDDDDVMRPEKIERQVAVLERNPDVGVVYTGIELDSGAVTLPDPAVRGNVLERALMYRMWPCMTSTMLIRRTALEQVLPFSDRPAANDIEFMIQLAAVTEFEFVSEPLLVKRMDDASLGNSMIAVTCRKEVLEDYRHLYDTYPRSVYLTALAQTFETEGVFLLRKRGWSPLAIASFARHLYYVPGGKAKALAKLLASLFGLPGWIVLTEAGRLLGVADG